MDIGAGTWYGWETTIKIVLMQPKMRILGALVLSFLAQRLMLSVLSGICSRKQPCSVPQPTEAAYWQLGIKGIARNAWMHSCDRLLILCQITIEKKKKKGTKELMPIHDCFYKHLPWGWLLLPVEALF